MGDHPASQQGVVRQLAQRAPGLPHPFGAVTIFALPRLSETPQCFNPDVLSPKVGKYIKAAEIGCSGSCHLFRRSCATHMLEGGADTRFIQTCLAMPSLRRRRFYTDVSIRQLIEVHERTHPAKLKGA